MHVRRTYCVLVAAAEADVVDDLPVGTEAVGVRRDVCAVVE
jgi:hypothetical protein